MKYSEALLKSKLTFKNQVKCRLVSNYDMEPFVKYLRAFGSEDLVEYKIEHSGYNNLLSDLYSITTNDNNYDFIFVLILIEDIFPEISYRTAKDWSLKEIEQLICTAEQRIKEFVDTMIYNISQLNCRIAIFSPYVQLPPITIIHNSLYSYFEMLHVMLQNQIMEHTYNNKSIRFFNEKQVFKGLSENNLRDLKLFFEAGIPFSLQGIEKVANALHQYFYQRTETKKLLITDLDNTLWSGIVGEDILSVSSLPESNTYHHYIFQNFLRLLSDEGILLAVCSKNNLKDVEYLFNNKYLLRDTGVRMEISDFHEFSCSWEPKSQQIIKICKNLNILPSSAVFVDDNPLELIEVDTALPDVTCIPFPKQQEFHEFLVNLRSLFIQDNELTQEDIDRNHYYEMKKKAEESIPKFNSYDDFLKSLNMKLEFEIIRSHEEERPFQLLNKTNQFNLNGLRFQKAEWREYLNKKDVICVTGKLIDKYGNHGVVLVGLLRVKDNSILIENAVLSCRVFNRSIETAFLDWITQHFDYIDSIKGIFRKTEKNDPCKDYFIKHNFNIESQFGENFTFHTNKLWFKNHYINF